MVARTDIHPERPVPARHTGRLGHCGCRARTPAVDVYFNTKKAAHAARTARSRAGWLCTHHDDEEIGRILPHLVHVHHVGVVAQRSEDQNLLDRQVAIILWVQLVQRLDGHMCPGLERGAEVGDAVMAGAQDPAAGREGEGSDRSTLHGCAAWVRRCSPWCSCWQGRERGARNGGD